MLLLSCSCFVRTCFGKCRTKGEQRAKKGRRKQEEGGPVPPPCNPFRKKAFSEKQYMRFLRHRSPPYGNESKMTRGLELVRVPRTGIAAYKLYTMPINKITLLKIYVTGTKEVQRFLLYDSFRCGSLAPCGLLCDRHEPLERREWMLKICKQFGQQNKSNYRYQF